MMNTAVRWKEKKKRGEKEGEVLASLSIPPLAFSVRDSGRFVSVT